MTAPNIDLETDNDESERARAFCEQGKIEEAVAIYQKLLDKGSPLKAGASYCLGVIFAATNRERAKDYFKASQALGYDLATYRLASMAHNDGDFEEALTLFKTIAPKNPSASYWIFRILEAHPELRKHDTEAQEFCRLALEQGHLAPLRDDVMSRLAGRRGLLLIPGAVVDVAKLWFRARKAANAEDELLYR